MDIYVVIIGHNYIKRLFIYFIFLFFRYTQSATERIEEIGKYKSAQQVVEVVHKRQGKPTKLLGRNFLRIIFENVKDRLINDTKIEIGTWIGLW